MPTRMLRDEILRSESVDALSMGAELFFRRLYSVVDDYGRYYASPRLLRADCYPLREDKSGLAVEDWLQECERQNLLRVYEVDAKQYLEILGFDQRTRSKSRFPDPPAPTGDGQVPVICPSNDRDMRADARHVTAERGQMPDICPPLRARASGAEGEGVVEDEGGGEARTRENTPPPLSEHDAGQIAELLRTAMPRGTPSPDVDIVRRVHAVRQGATLAEVAAVLVLFRRQKRRAPDSYGFWPIYLADALEPKARAKLNAIDEPRPLAVDAERLPACVACNGTGVVGFAGAGTGEAVKAAIAAGGRWCECEAARWFHEFFQDSSLDDLPVAQREAVAS